MSAVMNDNKEMAKLLISKGADVNFKNETGTTSLIISTTKVFNEIVELLMIAPNLSA
jgi:ankyrin repeat protein